MWIWTRIKNIGGNPDEEADLREEYGGEDPADEEYLGGAGFGAGLAVGDAAEVAEQYGVWKERNKYGKKSMGIERSTFVIDADGNVAKEMRRVKPDTHAADVLAVLS